MPLATSAAVATVSAALSCTSRLLALLFFFCDRAGDCVRAGDFLFDLAGERAGDFLLELEDFFLLEAVRLVELLLLPARLGVRVRGERSGWRDALRVLREGVLMRRGSKRDTCGMRAKHTRMQSVSCKISSRAEI